MLKCGVFDCDGVLVDAISSWRTLHDYFGTNSDEAFARFLRGEITDDEFMRMRGFGRSDDLCLGSFGHAVRNIVPNRIVK